MKFREAIKRPNMIMKEADRKMAKVGRGFFLALLVGLLIFPACSPGGTQSNEELRKEIQGLKGEVTALKEKLDKLQAGQQAILDLLKPPGVAPGAAAPGVPPQGWAALPEPQPSGPEPLTVGQLLAGKDRYLGARVTVRGPVGPVLVHHKSLLLKAPDGLVEVFFGKLPDEKQVQRLTSMSLDQPITVTGVVGPAPKGGAKLQIQAEAIEF
jgi:hypothetical protein